jgi:hypothetical protein
MEPIPAFDHAVTFVPTYSTSFRQQVHPSKGLHHYSTSWISYIFSVVVVVIDFPVLNG